MFTRGELAALGALFLVRAAAGMQFQSVAAVSPSLAPALGLDASEFGLLVGLYMLPGIGLTVAGGVAAQRFGDRPVLRVALLAMAAGAALGALADGFALAAAARLIAGVGGTLVLMLVVKIAAEHFRPGNVATAVAIALTGWPAGMGLGSLALTPIADAVGWRWALAAVGLYAVAMLALVPRPRRAPSPSATIAASALAGVARSETAAIAVVALTWGAFNAVLAILAAFLVRLADATGIAAEGLAAQTSALLWALALVTPFGGWLADRFGSREALIVGAMVAITLALAALLAVGPGMAWAIALGALMGVPPGPIAASLAPRVSPQRRGVAFGWFSSASALGITCGPALAGWLTLATASDWAAFWLALALSLVVLASGLSLRAPALRVSVP